MSEEEANSVDEEEMQQRASIVRTRGDGAEDGRAKCGEEEPLTRP